MSQIPARKRRLSTFVARAILALGCCATIAACGTSQANEQIAATWSIFAGRINALIKSDRALASQARQLEAQPLDSSRSLGDLPKLPASQITPANLKEALQIVRQGIARLVWAPTRTPPNFVAARYVSPGACAEFAKDEGTRSCAVALYRRFGGSAPLLDPHLTNVRVSRSAASGRAGADVITFVRGDKGWKIAAIRVPAAKR